MPAVLEGIRDLVASVDAVCDADPTQLADGETMQELYRQLDRLSAAATRATAAFDAGRSFEADGAKTAAAWVSVRCHVPITTARRRVQLGRALRHMAAVEEAWLAGDIGKAHATLFTRARTPEAATAFERDEALLVEHARTLRYDHFARTMAYWRQLADPDGTEGGGVTARGPTGARLADVRRHVDPQRRARPGQRDDRGQGPEADRGRALRG